MSKYQDFKILKEAIAAALNGEDELALLLTGSKKSWIYQLLSLAVSSRYFVDQKWISWVGILLSYWSGIPRWKPEVLKELDPHRHSSGNWWNWCTNESE